MGEMRGIDGAAAGEAAAPAEGYHYAIMRRAIDRLDRDGEAAPSLEAIAAEMSMSPAHFQRLFSRFVGVSPHRYRQWLALGHARTLLRERFTTLDTAGAVGLSGGGRLHDLFVRWEAMSPGDYARRGEGLTIRWGRFDSPFGPVLAMGTTRGLCGLGFTAETGEEAGMADLAGRWPRAGLVEDGAAIAPWVEAALARRGETAVHLGGGPFQIKVWEALLSIPTGRVTTYGAIAAALGAPKANRAVGAAVGRNPVSWLIPCHRAIAATGRLQGYHWGMPVKRAMLAWEAAETA